MKRSEFEALRQDQDEVISLYTGNTLKIERLDLKNGLIFLPGDDSIRFQDCVKAKGEPEILGFRLHHGVYQAKVIDNGVPSWHAVCAQGDQYYVMIGNVLAHDRRPVYFSQSDLREFLNFADEMISPRLFVDMDGTLAVFQQIDRLEQLYEKGYFAALPPIRNAVDAVRKICHRHDCEVYILSAAVDSPYAVSEKNQWLNHFLPEIPEEHRIFIPCGENKAEYVPYGIRKTDVLLDDYTKNLLEWPEKGIKLLNGINHTKGVWQGKCLDAALPPDQMAEQLLNCFQGVERGVEQEAEDYEME